MALRLNGSTSGFTTLDAPAVAGSNTLVLPTGNGSADQALVTNGSGTLSFADRGRMTLSTSQASTSGTAVNFTDVPSWAKKVTILFSGVGTTGANAMTIQIGTGGSYVTSGYAGTGTQSASASSSALSTTDFRINRSSGVPLAGSCIIYAFGGNTYVASLVMGATATGAMVQLAGSTITLAGVMDRFRVSTTSTDTFNAGSINVLYEG